MKKIISLLSVLVIVVAFCFSGCTFIETNLNGNGSLGGGVQNGGTQNGGTENQTPVVTPPVNQAGGVEFTTLADADRELLSLTDAVKAVERTSVAIKIGSGNGSGVVIGVKNQAETLVYVLTCHHVISDGGEVTVYLPDENCNYDNPNFIFKGVINASIHTDTAVTLVGGDRVSDVAVLKIDLNVPATSGNKLSPDRIVRANVPSSSYSVEKGEEIFAIGNPTGALPGSVSSGIVSYLERSVVVSDVGNMRLMQIGVSTNPGNSGGGLYNLYGELIGITNAGNTNYDETNFAIPCELSNGNGYVNIAKHLINSATATNYGYVPDRWEIGISIQEVRIGLSYYAQIAMVLEDSNAYGKLKSQDIIDSLSWNYNGSKTYKIEADRNNLTTAPSAFSFYSSLMRTELQKGDKFTVNVIRNNTPLSIEITIDKADYIFCNTGN